MGVAVVGGSRRRRVFPVGRAAEAVSWMMSQFARRKMSVVCQCHIDRQPCRHASPSRQHECRYYNYDWIVKVGRAIDVMAQSNHKVLY